MQLLRTQTDSGDHRFYADGRRISRNRYDEAFAGGVDCLSSERRGDKWRFYACARTRAPALTAH